MLDKTEQQGESTEDRDAPKQADPAQTAEFDYIDDWEEDSDASEAPEEEAAASGINPNRPGKMGQKSGADASGEDGQGPITRALEDFGSYLGDEELGGQGSNSPELSRSSASLSSSSFGQGDSHDSAGFDQSQASGVFSRYEEETAEGDSDDFDLFEEDDGGGQQERTLQEIVNSHEKQVRRLKKQLAYQKEVIQVVSELLVEARVVSKRALKKRLRALRDKSSK